MGGNKAKYFWQGFWDGIMSPFSFFLSAPAAEKVKRASAPAEDISAEAVGADEYARRQYKLFTSSIMGDNESVVPPYSATSLRATQAKMLRLFLRSAAREAKKY